MSEEVKKMTCLGRAGSARRATAALEKHCTAPARARVRARSVSSVVA